MDVTIRQLEALEEFEEAERLQRVVWVMPSDLGVIPLHLLLSAQRNGALVLGAFVEGKLAGLVFGYFGVTDSGMLKHCSHLMGILPEFQGQGIGFRLKLGQRKFALAQGCSLVTWTYDPLESRNAYLNIHKLGAICRTYYRDFYGPMDDGLNRGLPSDRFQVEWWIASERVARRASAAERPESSLHGDDVGVAPEVLEGEPAPGRLVVEEDRERAWVEIPARYQAVRASNAVLAAEWRIASRQAFEGCFAGGYVVTDFAYRAGRAFYLLTRGEK